MASLVRPDRVATLWADAEELILSLPGHRRARHLTLEYLWTWCRCGVYVHVSAGRLVAFIPFANTNFRNNWGLRKLLPAHRARWPREALQPGALEPEHWWCNAGVLSTQAVPGNAWSTVLFPEFVRLFSAAAARAPDIDAEVFLNKRDFPNVRLDGADPYGATFFSDGDDELTTPVVRPGALLPVLSCFVGSDFADVPIPLAQDHSVGVNGSAPIWGSRRDFDYAWGTRAPKAIFRGSATGCGCTPLLNPRLALLELCGPGSEHEDLFDVRITGRNARIRKHPGHPRLCCLPRASHRERDDFITLDEQRRRCRFAICIEGHSAAGRLAALLRHGFLVFLVGTEVAPADELFFTHRLVHRWNVVRCRLSDLPRAVQFYASSDGAEEAAHVAWEATLFYARWLVPDALEEELAKTLRATSVKD